MSAGVLAFDRDYRLRATNHGAESILRDANLNEIDAPLTASPRHAKLAQAIVTAFQERGGEWQQELEIENAGAAQALLLRGSTLPEAGGGGTVVVFDDITALISAQRTAAWGEVARRLAHEIKNPLTPIQLSAERLQMKLAGKLDPEAREMLDRSITTITTQVEAMKNMANDFRDYARTPSPKMAPLDLNALVRDVLALYEGSAQRIDAVLADALPRVPADANQLRQVLHNLIKNAAEAASEQTPAPSLFAADGPHILVTTRMDERRVILSVADNGSGFPPQILTRAFEPYVTTKAKGTGLGLAIVKKIVDEHHGEIALSNRADGGAEVTIRIPVAQT